MIILVITPLKGGGAYWNAGTNNPSATFSTAIQIQSGNLSTNTRNPQIQFHQYGYGGVQFRYDGPADRMFLEPIGSNRLDWIRFQTDTGYIELGPANAGWAHIYTDRPAFYLNKGLTVLSGSQINSGDIRSAIFYDSDNTGYYLDPSGASSRLNYLYIGEAAYSTSTNYVGLKTEHMSGANDYMMISGKTDGNTYISGKDGSGVYVRGGGNLTSNQIYIPDGSTITATTSSFQVTGDVVAYSSSDERLKDNKKNINNALEKVESLNGVEFDWNDKQDVYEGHDIGVIAQEVEKIAPELVSTRDNGYKAVKYEKLVPLLIEAIKELSDKVKALENK